MFAVGEYVHQGTVIQLKRHSATKTQIRCDKTELA